MHDALADRVANLERSNRRLRLWLFILTFAFVIILPFALVVSMLFMPFMMVRNVISGKSAYVSTFDGVAVMGFQNKTDDRRLELGVVRSGAPSLNLLGRDQRPRLALSITDNDIPTLMLYDPAWNGGFMANLAPDGRPQIHLRSPVGKGAIYIGFRPDGNPVMRFVDKDGNASVGFPSLGEPE